jgi:hypothetical protein
MTRVLYLGLSKGTLAELKKEFVVKQNLKYMSEMLNVVFQSFAIYANIIHEY